MLILFNQFNKNKITGDLMKKIFLLLFIITFNASLFSEEARILRYPNTSATQITFVHAGDVYIVPIEGGLARRVTSSEGLEMYPRFSPDGKQLVFSAEYDGNRFPDHACQCLPLER